MPGAAAIGPVNAAVDGFVRAAALELPNDLRINSVSPPLVLETAVKMGWGNQGMPAAELATAYVETAVSPKTGLTVFPGDG